ncbi:TetR/AcrR family transcriptional regulator [Micromonospora vulcania]|uniref:TetR/AcrR family transcriptional regulator n=1 Tax=Micromonospora vulcania TaxID=1441873 RepID=A0ABW1HHH9_9ACTN
MTEEAGGRLRADAKINQDRLLNAARRAFARDGVDTSLREIAKDAGVGIGTLYRRFPTREDLVWVVYRSEVDRICTSVAELLAQHPPVTALRTWMESFLEFLATKRAMADVLKAALARDDDQRLEIRDRLTTALATLLAAGVAEGSIRTDVAAFDVVMALGGIALVAAEPDQRAQAARQVDLLMYALRPLPSRSTGRG